MRHAPTLSGAHLTLRPPVPSDLDERLALGRSPEILRGFGAVSTDAPPLTRDEVVKWLDGLAASPTAWVIACKGRFLGEIRLRDVDLTDRRARLGIALYDPTLLGQGLGRCFPMRFKSFSCTASRCVFWPTTCAPLPATRRAASSKRAANAKAPWWGAVGWMI